MGSLFATVVCLLSSWIVSVSAASCSGALPLGVAVNNDFNYISLEVQGAKISFLLHLPKSYTGTSPSPVYFSYHGGSKNSRVQEVLSGLSNPDINPDGIAVYPQAVDGHYLSHPGTPSASPNDIDFALAMIDWLDANLCVDTKRIYATGKSNGGGLVNVLMCNPKTAAAFAAFAPVSGAFYMAKAINTNHCDAGGRVLPIIHFHGVDDTTIPYTGKVDPDHPDEPYYNTYHIDKWLRDWVKRNKCTNAERDSPVNETKYDGLVDVSTWSCGKNKNIVIHHKERELGHVWPSLTSNPDCPAIVPKKCPKGHYTFDATVEILKFFKKYQAP